MQKYVIIALVLISFNFAGYLSAEIIKLKDGQVINGQIMEQNEYSIVVKTRYQTRRISKDDILSVESGQAKLQPVYILTKDREVLSGFLVEEDSMQLKYKESMESDNIKTISKMDIVKKSNEEIRLIDLAMGLSTGVFYPFNSGGSKLDPAVIYFANIGFNSMIVKNMRFVLEAGYTESSNSSNSERRLQIVPVLVNAEYRYNISRKIELAPRAGLGAAIGNYNSGENREYSGGILAARAGFRITYAVRPYTLNMGLFADYLLLCDTSGLLHTGMGGACIEYRF